VVKKIGEAAPAIATIDVPIPVELLDEVRALIALRQNVKKAT
jgi:hypothetical protein